MKNVAVFFGGNSNEHEISVITGVYAVNLLKSAGYRVLPVYLPREGGMRLVEASSVKEFATPNKKLGTPAFLVERSLAVGKRVKLVALDAALNCCHGGAGEDGTLSALLKWNKIPLSSPPVAVSAIFMDKSLGKIAASGLGIPVAKSTLVREGEDFTASEFPVIVKPVTLGSSIGIAVAHNAEELHSALNTAFGLDNAALVEEYFPQKRDINCAAYFCHGRTVVSACEEVFSAGNILSFQEKYERAERTGKLPAALDDEISESIRNYTRQIYESFSCRGVVRADFLVVGDRVYFNELNTVPGSLATYLFGESLVGARELLKSLIETAITEGTGEKPTLTTGILSTALYSGVKTAKRNQSP